MDELNHDDLLRLSRFSLDKSGACIFWLQLDGRIVYVNEAVCSLLGYSAETIMTMNVLNIDVAHTPDEVRTKMQQIRQEGQITFESRHKASSGHIFPVHVILTLFEFEGRELIFAFVEDITERKKAEQALEVSHNRMINIIESVPDGFIAMDHELVVTFFNRAAETLLRRKAEEVLGKPLFDVFPEARGSVFEEKYTQAVREQQPLMFETFFSAEPYANWYEVRVFPLDDGIAVFFQSITDRKANEFALIESEQKFRTIFEAASDAIMMIDADCGVVLDANEQAGHLCGMARGQLIGTHFTHIHPPDMRDDLICAFRSDVSQGRIFIETVVRHISGRIIPVQISGRKTRLAKRDVIVGIYIELSELRHVEKTLREQQAFMNNIIWSMEDVLLVFNERGCLSMTNQAALILLGYGQEQLEGMHFSKLVGADEVLFFDAGHGMQVAGGNIRSAESCLVCSDGRSVPVLLSGSVLRYPDDSLSGLLVIAKDITELKRIENERVRHREDMAQASKMIALGTLTSGLAHEINNPTNFIMINTPILKDTCACMQRMLDERLEKEGDFMLDGMPYSQVNQEIPVLFKGIEEGAQRIRDIVRDLKEFAHPAPKSYEQEVDINNVLRVAINLLQNTIKKATFRFRIEYGKNLPRVCGNSQRLEQVMINLIQNACQALTDREQAIWVTSFYRFEKKRVLVRIKDEGVGIDEDNLARIRDPFFTTKRDRGGMGLGLSLSSQILRNHKAELEIESSIGGGSTFTISIPVLD